MLFNGKYYNKPGHLGMTTEELKAALEALPTPEAGDAGKPVVVNEDGDGYVLGETGGGEKLYQHKIRSSGVNSPIVYIYNTDATPFTKDTFLTYIKNNSEGNASGGSEFIRGLPCIPSAVAGGTADANGIYPYFTIDLMIGYGIKNFTELHTVKNAIGVKIKDSATLPSGYTQYGNITIHGSSLSTITDTVTEIL